MSAHTILRPALPDDAVAIATVRVDSWRSTYRGMIPDSYLDAMTVEGSAALWHRVLTAAPNTTNTFVASVDDVVRGFGSAMMLDPPKHGFDAELTGLYVAPSHQRQGLGRRLLGAVAGAQRGSGASGLIVWVIAANRAARAFYESLGGELVIEQPFQWDGLDLVEAGYGWRRIDTLIEACGPLAVAQH